jgi:hypothetical protein
MTLSRTFIAAAVALAIGVPPAHAQHRGGGGGHRGGSAGGNGENAQRAAPQGSSVRSAVPGPRGGSSGPSRSMAAPRSFAAPRVYTSSRGFGAAPRSFSYGAPRVYAADSRRGGGVVVGRGVSRVIAPRVVGSHVGYAPYHFYRPYYAFRPRVSLGFGLWVGFPVAYPYAYGYYNPYYYPYSYPYPAPYPAYGYPYPSSYPAYPPATYPGGYPSSTYPQPAYPPPTTGSVGVQPGQSANMGGVSFEITPSTAEVFIDGEYIGTVGDFTPRSQPLGLTPGRHRIEIRAEGYQAMNIQADIVAGQVIPYQGALQR